MKTFEIVMKTATFFLFILPKTLFFFVATNLLPDLIPGSKKRTTNNNRMRPIHTVTNSKKRILIPSERLKPAIAEISKIIDVLPT